MSVPGIKAESKSDKYFFVMYGDVPRILIPCVAYRRVGQQKSHDIRIINCPYCNNPLTEVGRDTKVELYRYPARRQIHCHAYPVCQVCKNEVGMILA